MKSIRFAAPVAVLATAVVAAVSPAAAWWQFVSVNADGSRQVHSPYKDEAACQAALKKTEADMKAKFPNQFPLVGSCEEYQGGK